MIILCAALKIKETGVIIPCCRHYNGWAILHDLGFKFKYDEVEQGFINTKK